MALLFENKNPASIVLLDQNNGATLSTTTILEPLTGTASTIGYKDPATGLMRYLFSKVFSTNISTNLPADKILVSVTRPTGATATIQSDSMGYWEIIVSGPAPSNGQIPVAITIQYPSLAAANGIEVNNIYYDDNFVWGGPLMFTLNQSGTAYSVKANPGATLPRELHIPSQHNGIPVTKIEDEGFLNTDIDAVYIPYSITKLGISAFEGCNATEIQFPYGSSLTSISSNAFCYCENLESFRVPNGITKINSGAFYGCISLQALSLPTTLTDIETGAFAYCDSLEILSFPNNVSYIEDDILEGVPLKYVYISETTYNAIKNNAVILNGVSFTHSLVIFTSATSIGDLSTSFSNSNYKVRLGYAIPENTTEMEKLTYTELPDLNYSVGWDGRYDVQQITIPITYLGKRVSQIKEYGFYPYNDVTGETTTSYLSEIVIPDTIDKIGVGAFVKSNQMTRAWARGYWNVGAGTAYVDGEATSDAVMKKYLVTTYADKEWVRDSNLATLSFQSVTPTTPSNAGNLAYNVQINRVGGTGILPYAIEAQGKYVGSSNVAGSASGTISPGEVKTVKVEFPKWNAGATAQATSVTFKAYIKYPSTAVQKIVTIS